MKPIRRVSLMAFTLLATLIPATPAVSATGDPVLINEILASTTGTDSEYIEFFGTPGAPLGGLSFIVVESDDRGDNGNIDRRYDFADDVVLGGNGYLLLANSTAEATYGVSANISVPADYLENGSSTYALVDTDSISGPVVDSDIVVHDAVAATDGEAITFFAFDAPVIGPDGSFLPAGVGRIEDGVDTDSVDDWSILSFSNNSPPNTPTPGTFGEPEPVLCDSEALTLISAVQGPGFSSPISGNTVTIEGSITGVFPELDGFTVQEEPVDDDGIAATSDGVFVEAGDVEGLKMFDIVQVTGEVEESFGNTQIVSDVVAICDVAPVAITPIPLTLPADDATRESVEGSLVVTTQDLTVTSLFTAYRFGELGVSSSGVLQQATDVFAPGSPQSFALEEANAQDLLFIDDRGEFGRDNDPWFGDAGDRAGDIVEAGVVGAIYYSFGDYLLEPIGDFPEVVDGAPAFSSREPAPQFQGGTDIGAFNVLNYFNTFGNSEALRGARSQAQFDVQSAKIVDAIVNLDSAILGLIELENDYEDSYDSNPLTEPSIQTLVDQLNAATAAGTYDWVRIPEELLTGEGIGGGGLGPDAIAVGIIYQPDRVTQVGEAATFDIDALLTGEDPDNNRWPLAASFDVDGQVVTVMVNHFKSKGSTCDDTIVPAGFGDGQDDPQTSSCDLVREYAAERVIEWARTKPTGVQSPDMFVVGDLNSYAEEDPVRIFEKAGYVDLIERYDDGAFTYKFDGRYGRLDYIMASPSAKRLVDDAEVWQVNSPEPYGYLYSNEHIDLTAYASSDHDAVVAAISKPGHDPKK